MTSPIEALVKRLQQNPTDAAALDGIQEQLAARGDFAKLEKVLDWLAKALRDRRAEPGLTADVHRRLGTIRREKLGDIQGAIAAFEGALAARADDLSAMHELANLYVTRGRSSGADADFARAGQLYFGVASRVPGARAISYAEAALDCDAGASQPLELLERLYELPRDRDKLVGRWEQFIARAPDGPDVDRRRTRLAREYTLDRRLEDALACLEPLAAKGMDKAQQAVTHLRKKLGRRAPPPARAYQPSAMDEEEEAKTTLRQGPGEALLMAPPGSPPKGLFGSDPFAAPAVEYSDADRTDPMGAPADAEAGGPPLFDPLLIEDHPEIELEMETTTDKVVVARGRGDVPAFADDRARPPAPEPGPPPRRPSGRPGASPSAPPGSPSQPPRPRQPLAVQVILPRDGTEPTLYTDGEEEAEESGRAELEYVEPFPVDTILADREVRASRSGSRKTAPVLEIIRLSGDRLVGSDVLRWPGQGMRPRRAPFSVRRGATGATLRIRSAAEGSIWRAGAATDAPPEDLPPPGRVRLRVDDVAEIQQGALRWRLRVFRPPIKPIGEGWWRDLPWKVFLACTGLAAFEHLLLLGIFLGLATLGVSFKVEDRPQEEVFAEVRLRAQREPRAEVIRPPRPIRRRRQVREESPPEPAEDQVRIPRSLRNKLRQIARTRTESDSTNRLVNALRSPVQGEGQSVSEVVSNIEAVEGGSQSGAFRVGGTLAALEGTGVNIASGGGGDVGTVGGQTATKNLERMQAGGGRVRGRVRGVQALARVQGSLSRGEVLAVLNRAIGRIQRCYERSLTANPNLSGRIAFSWTIRPNGSVGGVRETSSTLGNPAVSTCISGVIRGLRFPRPTGGPVEVTFPFMFQRVQ